MKKMILMAIVTCSMVVSSGCASWTPEQKAKFETIVEQAITVGIPQAQKLVDKNIEEGNLTQKQGDLIMKLVMAYADKMQTKLNK
jgi:hypothetical protein